MVWISGDDPDSITILAVYWPYGGSNRPPLERKERALQALIRMRPEISEQQAQEKVESIIQAEQEEYRIAVAFCKMAMFYLMNINKIIDRINTCSEKLPNLRGMELKEQSDYLWSQIAALLSYAGSLHRILVPQSNVSSRDKNREQKLEDREKRRRILRFYLDYDENILQELNKIRGVQQHFDEHIDDFINGRRSLMGKQVVDHVIIGKSIPKDFDILRSFDPSSLTLKMLDKSYCLKRLSEFLPLFIMVVWHNVFCRGGRYSIQALSLSGTHI